MENPQKLSDKELFKLCREFGSNALKWRWKFAGLLPEVFKRRLYEKKGFGSIFVFAAKLAGMSQEQVMRVLNIEKKFEDKPALKNILINGEVSVNKLARVVSIATVENQQELANYVKVMSNRAIETFVRDEKAAQQNYPASAGNLQQPILEFENQNGLQEPIVDHKSVHVHTNVQSNSESSSDAAGGDQSLHGHTKVQSNSESSSGAVGGNESLHGHTNSQSILPYVKILEQLSPTIKEKLLTLLAKGIDLNALIAQMLQNREAEIAAAKNEIVAEMEEKAEAKRSALEVEQKSSAKKSAAKKPSRYIPVKIRKIIKLEQGDKCSFPGCKNPEENMHHTQRFALTQNHNPFFLAQSCKSHHEIAHTVDVKYQEKRKRVIG